MSPAGFGGLASAWATGFMRGVGAAGIIGFARGTGAGGLCAARTMSLMPTVDLMPAGTGLARGTGAATGRAAGVGLGRGIGADGDGRTVGPRPTEAAAFGLKPPGWLPGDGARAAGAGAEGRETGVGGRFVELRPSPGVPTGVGGRFVELLIGTGLVFGRPFTSRRS